MSKSREELERLLQRLESLMPVIAGESFDDRTFWPQFWRLAKPLEDAAAPADREFVRTRLSCILGAWGLIPSDHEGRPCSDRAA